VLDANGVRHSDAKERRPQHGRTFQNFRPSYPLCSIGQQATEQSRLFALAKVAALGEPAKQPEP